MVELKSQTPLAGMSPVTIGRAQMSEAALGTLTTLAPFKGQDTAFAKAFKAAHGLAAPAPGRATGREGARALWFGQRMVLLAGPTPEPGLSNLAALTDQSDAWAALRLEGEDAGAVLARLTPLDLRASAFKRGHSARSELAHMPVSLTRLSEQAFLVLTFRSMGQTLLHEMTRAMEGVAARRGP